LPYFLFRFRYPLASFEFSPWSPIIEILLYSFLGFLFFKKQVLANFKIIYFFYFIYIVLNIHLFLLGDWDLYNAISLLRLYVYLFCLPFCFVLIFFDKISFLNTFIICSECSLLLILLSYLINPSYFSIYDYETFRPCLLFSEPSSLGPIVGALCSLYFLKDQYAKLLCLFIIAYWATSIITFIALTISIIYIAWIKAKQVQTKTAVTIFSLGLISFLLMSPTYPSTRLRNEILNAKSFSFDLSKINKETRFGSIIYSLKMNKSFINALLGNGFNTIKKQEQTKEVRCLSLSQMMLSSFGILGLGIFFCIGLYVFYLNHKNQDFVLNAIYLNFFLCSMINSAEGSFLWKYPIMLMICALRKK